MSNFYPRGRSALVIGFAGLVSMVLGSGAISVFAEDNSDQTKVEHSTDVSKNPITGNTTVTKTTTSEVDNNGAKKKYKNKMKKKYDKAGKKIEQSQETHESATDKK